MYCSACGTQLSHDPPVRCRGCGTSHWLDAKPCAGALVTSNGRVLLVRRAHEPWRGRWDVPGGFCEPREHPVATAEREAREEAGLAVRVVGFLGIWLDEYDTGSGGGSTASQPAKVTLNIYYHAVPCDGGPVAAASPGTDSEEVEEARWFAPDELPAEGALAFPRHVAPVLAAWREAVRTGALESPLPDRPHPGPGAPPSY
jgi:8-oxo-dGTP pyrophosphatase MutT (NUDIX family)